MAAIAVPAGGITLSSTEISPLLYTGGATIASGVGVYPDASDGNELKAVDVTAAASAAAVGFLLQATADGKGALVAGEGCIIGGFSGLTVGQFVAFDTGGSLVTVPATDLTAGEYLTWAGYVYSATEIFVKPIATGLTI